MPLPRLRTFALVYEAALRLIIAYRTVGKYYPDTGLLPNLTWAPAIATLFR